MNLEEYSLNPEEYDSLVTFTGVVSERNEDTYKVLLDDGVILEVVLHPKVIDSYTALEVTVDEDDEVDMLGTYINVDDKPTILVLRCVIYERTSDYLS